MNAGHRWWQGHYHRRAASRLAPRKPHQWLRWQSAFFVAAAVAAVLVAMLQHG